MSKMKTKEKVYNNANDNEPSFIPPVPAWQTKTVIGLIKECSFLQIRVRAAAWKPKMV